jgi:deoxyribodipyrimidine photo-lyase
MSILVWFRKDLRLDDHTALAEAVGTAGRRVVPFYTGEPSLLARPDMAPVRVRFVLESLAALDTGLRAIGSHLALVHGEAVDTVVAAARAAGVDAVYWNDGYEPSQRWRDDAVERALRDAGLTVRRFHDRLLVPPGAVATQSGGPYTVYSPYRRACEALPIAAPWPAPTRLAPNPLPSRRPATLAALGFETPAAAPWPGGEPAARARLASFLAPAAARLARYATHRDFPAVPAHSRLSADLCFGTLGIRRVVAEARAAGADPKAVGKFVDELRWRDFYAQVLFHFPHCETSCFRPEWDAIRWRGTEAWFVAWCEGRTGYPFVDAGMRELRATGSMHNRVRMVVASFLTKDLLTDWRRGERWFMQHLVDGDLANNNGGWQWAAGTGTDAAPYFRVFNPVLQGLKFDPDGTYTRRWVPELARVPGRHLHAPWEAPPLALAEAGVTLGEDYPFPIVDHATQRDAALAMYGEVKRG